MAILTRSYTMGALATHSSRRCEMQMSNPRNPKYKFKISDVPADHLIFVKNFNEDAEEFAEEFPDFLNFS